jgi:hypothetical protein
MGWRKAVEKQVHKLNLQALDLIGDDKAYWANRQEVWRLNAKLYTKKP